MLIGVIARPWNAKRMSDDCRAACTCAYIGIKSSAARSSVKVYFKDSIIECRENVPFLSSISTSVFRHESASYRITSLSLSLSLSLSFSLFLSLLKEKEFARGFVHLWTSLLKEKEFARGFVHLWTMLHFRWPISESAMMINLMIDTCGKLLYFMTSSTTHKDCIMSIPSRSAGEGVLEEPNSRTVIIFSEPFVEPRACTSSQFAIINISIWRSTRARFFVAHQVHNKV